MPSRPPPDDTHGGVAFRGQIAVPEGDGPHPAVPVMHDAMGPGAQLREIARAPATLAAYGDVDAARIGAAGAHRTLTVFGKGYHAFSNPDEGHGGAKPGIRYDPLLGAMGRAATLALCAKTLH